MSGQTPGSGRQKTSGAKSPRVPSVVIVFGAESTSPVIWLHHCHGPSDFARIRLTLEASRSNEFKAGIVAALSLHLAALLDRDNDEARRLIEAAFEPDPAPTSETPRLPATVRGDAEECGKAVVPDGKYKGHTLVYMARYHRGWLRAAYTRKWLRYWSPFRHDLEEFVAELDAKGWPS